ICNAAAMLSGRMSARSTATAATGPCLTVAFCAPLGGLVPGAPSITGGLPISIAMSVRVEECFDQRGNRLRTLQMQHMPDPLDQLHGTGRHAALEILDRALPAPLCNIRGFRVGQREHRGPDLAPDGLAFLAPVQRRKHPLVPRIAPHAHASLLIIVGPRRGEKAR